MKMAEELSIISSDLLTGVSETDIDKLIEQLVDESKENMDKICDLTLECTALLSSAENRANALSDQKAVKRLIRNITGKNQKLCNAILKDNTNAMYLAQGVINRVMLECLHNRKLMVAINDRISDIDIDIKEGQNRLNADVLAVRQAVVAFYNKYKQELLTQDERIAKMEEYAKERCPQCRKELLLWQRICPFCGYIHRLKGEYTSDETRKTLEKMSAIIKDESFSEDIIWNNTVKKIEQVLRKVKSLAEVGRLPGYTEELDGDIVDLIEKCKTAEFQIAIVGIMKAGKSFMMNALMGVELASVDVNPETAALTKFRSASGYYINVKFHDKNKWNCFIDSVKKSKTSGKNSLKRMLADPNVIKMENIWVGHDDLHIVCDNLAKLRTMVKKYTSSQIKEHLFVSEVEVGVDRKIFNMPPEVIFVDTPGLEDPVKYRSDITRDYIKKADAVLIAVPTEAMTAERNEIITTVLDCIDEKKTFIVGTKKEMQTKRDQEKIVSRWVKQLVGARRYSNARIARSKIVLISAKMELLVNKWLNLSEEERGDANYFSDDDFCDLERYVKRVTDDRFYNISDLSHDEISCYKIAKDTGISILREKLENTLISKYRDIKSAEIQKSYSQCKKKLYDICKRDIKDQEKKISIAEKGAGALKQKKDKVSAERKKLQQESDEIKNETKQLEKEISVLIELLDRKDTK